MRRQKRICLSKDRVRLRILGMQCLILPKDEDKPPTYAAVRLYATEACYD